MARAGETVELAEREVTIHALDLVDVGRHRPGPADRRPRRRAAPPARTSARSRATSGEAARAARPTSGRCAGPRPARSAIDDADRRSTTIRAAAAEGPTGSCPLLRPLDTGLDAFPVVTLTADEVAAVARGQFVRPDGRPARAGRALPPARRRPARWSRSPSAAGRPAGAGQGASSRRQQPSPSA